MVQGKFRATLGFKKSVSSVQEDGGDESEEQENDGSERSTNRQLIREEDTLHLLSEAVLEKKIEGLRSELKVVGERVKGSRGRQQNNQLLLNQIQEMSDKWSIRGMSEVHRRGLALERLRTAEQMTRITVKVSCSLSLPSSFPLSFI